MMEPSESTSTHAVAIVITPNLPPPILTIPPPPPPSPTIHSPPLPSSPEFVDLLRCNHQNLWNCFRNLKTYMGCFKSQDSSSLEIKGGIKEDRFVGVSSRSTMPSPNYYSDMNSEERDEKLKSAIVYCNHSTN
ncbi:hypothetical protein L2E82_02930 [Cichorium intybus]|uniref:Uncharacterized protein n=1 Tax=Cichorium intybus TaxID=13427 RepID=A0ACB9H3L9_CICIN|nr:hypothetical protein L2E82_02930 [Cichorium intybus]